MQVLPELLGFCAQVEGLRVFLVLGLGIVTPLPLELVWFRGLAGLWPKAVHVMTGLGHVQVLHGIAELGGTAT